MLEESEFGSLLPPGVLPEFLECSNKQAFFPNAPLVSCAWGIHYNIVTWCRFLNKHSLRSKIDLLLKNLCARLFVPTRPPSFTRREGWASESCNLEFDHWCHCFQPILHTGRLSGSCLLKSRSKRIQLSAELTTLLNSLWIEVIGDHIAQLLTCIKRSVYKLSQNSV